LVSSLNNNSSFPFIANELKKITSNVRLGFGAFVDKQLAPYSGTRAISIENPCFPQAHCYPMYGFKHQLRLTHNISIFGDRVRETPISGNQDGPEGGFDALVQAMACEVRQCPQNLNEGPISVLKGL